MANISYMGQYSMEEEEEDMNSVLPVVDEYSFSDDCTGLDPNLSSKEESGSNSSEKVEEEETSAITTQIDDDDESTSLDSGFGEVNESSPNLPLFLLSLTRKLVVELIEFHIHIVILFCIFPVWLLRSAYTSLVDPFGFISAGKLRLAKLLSRIWVFTRKILFPFILTWVMRHKLILIKLASNFGLGLLWASYFGFLLVILLVSALIITALIMRILVTEPIQMKETLTFDYTKHSPVAYVPIMFENDQQYHKKLQVTVSMIMPESDYNRNLGIFQIRLDFLSKAGEIVASSSLPCMLRFRSEPVRLLSSILKAASIVAGYSSESQTIEVKFRNMKEVELSSIACLRVSMEQRAEFRKGAGIPELYDSFVLVESEISLSKRIIWQWKTTIFIWISTMIFTVEMMFSLLYCRYIPMPKLRTSSHGSTMS